MFTPIGPLRPEIEEELRAEQVKKIKELAGLLNNQKDLRSECSETIKNYLGVDISVGKGTLEGQSTEDLKCQLFNIQSGGAMITSIEQMPSVKPVPKFSHDLGFFGKANAWFSRREWFLDENPYWYYQLPDGTITQYPHGFIFDFASVPRIFHPLLNPVGLLLIASIPHDFIYRYGYLETDKGVKIKYNRKQADKLLQNITVYETNVYIGAWVAKMSVRVGGSGSYKV